MKLIFLRIRHEALLVSVAVAVYKHVDYGELLDYSKEEN